MRANKIIPTIPSCRYFRSPVALFCRYEELSGSIATGLSNMTSGASMQFPCLGLGGGSGASVAAEVFLAASERYETFIGSPCEVWHVLQEE